MEGTGQKGLSQILKIFRIDFIRLQDSILIQSLIILYTLNIISNTDLMYYNLKN